MKLTGLQWRFDWLRCQRCEGRKFYALRLPSTIDELSVRRWLKRMIRPLKKKAYVNRT